MSIRCKEIEVDFPTIGKYYGEKIPVIFSIDSDDTPDYQGKRDIFVDRFVELKPYKELYHVENIIHVHSQHITNSNDLISEIKLMAAQAESILNLREGSKILAVIWAPYWRMGDGYSTLIQEGKYIYAIAVMRNALIPYRFPGKCIKVKHEINHLLGMRGDNFIMDVPNLPALSCETCSDYMEICDTPRWMAEDELRMITHLQFNNGVAYSTFPFGCRNGELLYWYHNYVNTPTPHRDYSATWQEVKSFVDRIGKGEFVNRNPCQS